MIGKFRGAVRNPVREAPASGTTGRIAAGALAALVAHEPALADEGLKPRLDAVIDRWGEAEKIVGTVAMIARDGRIVYRRAAGFADRAADIPGREHRIFRDPDGGGGG